MKDTNLRKDGVWPCPWKDKVGPSHCPSWFIFSNSNPSVGVYRVLKMKVCSRSWCRAVFDLWFWWFCSSCKINFGTVANTQKGLPRRESEHQKCRLFPPAGVCRPDSRFKKRKIPLFYPQFNATLSLDIAFCRAALIMFPGCGLAVPFLASRSSSSSLFFDRPVCWRLQSQSQIVAAMFLSHVRICAAVRIKVNVLGASAHLVSLYVQFRARKTL